jgi:hypothetical protein
MNKHRIGALIAAAALTLTFAGTAFAATENWAGNGYPVNEDCKAAAPGTFVWIWTGDSPTALTVNGVAQGGTWDQSGPNGSWKFVTDWFSSEPDHDTTFVTFTGDDGILTITHGCAPETTTTTSSEETTSSTTTEETSSTTTTEETSSTTTSNETTSTSTTTQPTGSLFAFPTFSIECGGAITVTNFAAAAVDDALVTGPGADLVITEDGTYPLEPGDYVGVGRVGGVAQGDEVQFTIVACPTTTTSTSAEETTPGGSVEELTPPSTDTIGQASTSSTVSTSLLLVLAGVLASALVVIPAAARKRR